MTDQSVRKSQKKVLLLRVNQENSIVHLSLKRYGIPSGDSLSLRIMRRDLRRVGDDIEQRNGLSRRRS